MPKLPPNRLRIAVDVGRIASAPGTSEERAELLLEPLRRLVPFQAACILMLDTTCRESMPLVTYGYDEGLRGYMKTPDCLDEVDLLGLEREHRAMRVQDLPVPRQEIRSWVEYLEPAGYKEGLAVGLFTSDGRYVGVLCLSTEDPKQPTAAARDLIGVLAPVIANAVDPLRSIFAVAGLVDGAQGGVVLTAGGDALPLPGMPPHPLLAPGSDALAVAERRSRGMFWGSFLHPLPDADGDEGHARLTVLACPSQAPYRLVSVVMVSPPGELYGLTPRELQIAGLLIEGWPNQRIAAHLFIAERTVATHVEHILAKLNAPTRASAAVRALQYGLYVPRRELSVHSRGV